MFENLTKSVSQMVCLIWKFSRGGQRTAFFQASQNGARTVIVFARHAGPFLNKDMALVFWDQYVWYPVVEFTTSTSADSFIPLFTRVFNMFGILKRLSRTMGSRLMDRNFQTLLRNRDSKIERSLLPGLRPMETENVFCRCWKRAPKSPDLKGNSFDRKFKKPLATIVLCPTKWQSRPRTRLRLEESYVGNYPKG